jgi:hypothetical protein
MKKEEKMTEVSGIRKGYRTCKDCCAYFYNKKETIYASFLFVRIMNLVHLKLNAVHLNG